MGPQKSLRRKKSTSPNGGTDKFVSQKYNLPNIEFSVWNLFGFLICIGCGALYSYTVCQVHEARLFFTGIMEIEREISFRTENGLYYSYYKQLVNAPSFIPEIYNLTRDRLTEHPIPINILARMNIYQEVLLAAIYRYFPFISSWLDPIFFYIYFIFTLHGILVSSLFLMSWIISGTWLAGCLTFLFYVSSSMDVTRVETYMPLRENFALPCLWLQLLVMTIYFKDDLSEKYKGFCEKCLLVLTFLFALMWQFNQFALLLQAMSLFGCQTLNVVEKKKIQQMYVCLLASMSLVSLLQFCNTMIFSGFLLSFVTASVIVMKIQERFETSSNFYMRVAFMFGNIFLVFLAASVINFVLKIIFQQEADEHIIRFVLTKFGFNSSVDFDVRLYLCNGGFVFLSWDFFERLTENFVFPFYTISHLILLVLLLITVIKRLKESAKAENDNEFQFQLSPELAYHSIQMVFFGAVGIMALRMKYFWTPYMCVFASVCIFKAEPWLWISGRILKSLKASQVKGIHTAVGVILISYLALNCFKNVREEWNNLREFYDPDTVELLEWIKNSTSTTASFSGSMQLLAGVKLCTGRRITNHPHYEDKALRLKTKELYKYYGRYTAEEVYDMLKKFETDYIIMEDSICLVPLKDGCGLPYIMDMEAGLELDSKGSPLKADVLPRFCDEVRRNKEPYSTFFKLVLHNRTFRVYKVL